MNKKIGLENFCLAVVVSLFLIAEFFCAKLAYETLGAIDSSLYFLLMALNIVPLLLIFLGKKYVGMFVVISIGLAIIPYQLYLGNRLLLQKEEAANIAVYLYEQKLATGQFPVDLNGYTFTHPNLKSFFNYYKISEGYSEAKSDEYILSYFTGTRSTSHFIQLGSGGWGYYPD